MAFLFSDDFANVLIRRLPSSTLAPFIIPPDVPYGTPEPELSDTAPCPFDALIPMLPPMPTPLPVVPRSPTTALEGYETPLATIPEPADEDAIVDGGDDDEVDDGILPASRPPVDLVLYDDLA